MKTMITALLFMAALTISAQNDSLPGSYIGNAHKTPTGIVVVGTGCKARAMSTFIGSPTCLQEYANVANMYADTFKGKAQVYVMPIPLSFEFYSTDETNAWYYPQEEAINGCFNLLNDDVKSVEIISALRPHKDEGLYSRTDHHWAPLGAYYAAQAFAKVANVPFLDLTHYTQHVVRDFSGTMYKFSKDPSMKDAKEDFIYYTPNDTNYTTTYVDYTLDKSRKRVISETEPKEGKFFYSFADGSHSAYLTFMHGDSRLVKVQTDAKSHRHLLILKDSFGNALPCYLFSSFSEIHVVDCRYFTQNIIDYVNNNGITDILFANNVTHAKSAKTTEMYKKYLTQHK